MECPDGEERNCFPLLATHVVDHKEGLKAANTKKTHCIGCDAHQGHLHYLNCNFKSKSTDDMKKYYEEHRCGLVDEFDRPLHGKGEEVKRREANDLGGTR